MEQKFVKNPNWWEAAQLAIYKAWRSWIRDHRRQIYLVAGTRDVRIKSPAPNHLATLPPFVIKLNPAISNS